MRLTLTLLFFCAFLAGHSQLDRRLANVNQPQVSTAKPEKVDYTGLALKKLKEELTLDAFQEAVVSNLLKENQEIEEKVMVQDVPKESKIEMLTKQRNRLTEKIKEILTPEQVEKFEKFQKKKKK
jgi:hypothetical protein